MGIYAVSFNSNQQGGSFMKRALMSLGVLIGVASLSGCGIGAAYYQPSGVTPTAGIVMETTSGGILHDNGVTPTKTGKACGTSILGIVASGDTTVEAAMNNGGIKKAVFTQQQIRYFVWGAYVEICTIAKGN
jgi:predicted small lipoprotein YifL